MTRGHYSHMDAYNTGINDVTGDTIKTKVNSDQAKFEEGFDRIFGKKDRSLPKPPKGYTAEELERDNPYNQWMSE